MLRVLASRLAQMGPVLFIVSAVIFSVTQLLPGDAALTMLGDLATEEQRLAAREELGLDDPIPVQYAKWAQRVAVGDFGRSIRTREPVLTMIADRLPVTIELTILSIAVAVIIGVPLGLAAAVRHGTWTDTGISFVSIAGLAIPNFWAGILLIMLFTLVLGWLPPSGYVSFFQDPLQNLRLMILPSLTLGTALAALIMRQTRASTLGVLNQDYVRTARSKGLSDTRILLRHVLRNAMIPVTTVIGLQVGKVLGGTVIVETIFSLPGIGQLVVAGIFGRDYPVVQASVLLIVVMIMLVNMAVDILYNVLDPRIEI
jgi:peptide/nickel transport system permease protein